MALSDLAVFSEYAYETAVEVLAQQVQLFNAASEGAIQLQAAAHMGDFSEGAMWARISGLVRRRNVYGTGTVGEKTLAMLSENMVKIAAGTPPVRIDPSMFSWIKKAPTEAGVIIGQQLGPDILADMLNTGLIATRAALANVPALLVDKTADAGAKYKHFNDAQRPFGDRASDIVVWVMHSAPLFDMYGNNLANSEQLFTGGAGGNIAVRRDPFGRLFVITDSPALVESITVGGNANTTVYDSLGLVRGAIQVDQNADYDDNIATLNGNENITRTYQAEWTYNLGVKGFAWDKTNGGKSPTDAAIAVGTNWDRWATYEKDMAGVVLRNTAAP